ncbi:MAG TPA: type II toxin-antitoxin system VapC family toxin [Micromonosporaceae bacterium]
MRLLLDTHAVIWSLSEPNRLSSRARAQIADPGNDVAISAASAWEIAIKTAAGKLKVATSELQASIEATGFSEVPITVEHALTAGQLPAHHRDPFDRMLVAQALLDGWTLVTRDRAFAAYGVPILVA